MLKNNLEKIYIDRNKSRMGSVGLYGLERAELFSGWLGQDKKILELGCRDGSLTKLFATNNQVIGADIDKGALSKFEKNLGSKGHWIDLNNDWPFGIEEFDAVVASEVLEHLYDPEQVIRKVAKTLKPGGLFMGSVPNAFSLANRIRLFLAQPKKTALSDPTHVHQFSYGELKNMLKRHFYEVDLVPLGRFSFLGKVSPALFSFLIIFRCKK